MKGGVGVKWGEISRWAAKLQHYHQQFITNPPRMLQHNFAISGYVCAQPNCTNTSAYSVYAEGGSPPSKRVEDPSSIAISETQVVLPGPKRLLRISALSEL
ncbi:hypothetical protein FKM82_023800 [Ascaphus truei]